MKSLGLLTFRKVMEITKSIFQDLEWIQHSVIPNTAYVMLVHFNIYNIKKFHYKIMRHCIESFVFLFLWSFKMRKMCFVVLET